MEALTAYATAWTAARKAGIGAAALAASRVPLFVGRREGPVLGSVSPAAN